MGMLSMYRRFFLGVNDPFGLGPPGTPPFDPNIFDLYKYWQSLRGDSDETQARESVARGEEVFTASHRVRKTPIVP